MSRYLIERDFPDGLSIPQDEGGASLCRQVIDNNAEDGVTWVHSYVTPDHKRTFCIYDGPDTRSRAPRRGPQQIAHFADYRGPRPRSVLL